MGEVPTMQERESLDRHVTGNYGEDSIGGEPVEIPILLAWQLVDKTHSPLPGDLMNAIEKARAEHPLDSEVATEMLREYYAGAPEGDAERDEARVMFSRGWDAGIERGEVEEALDGSEDGWEVRAFSYLLGHLTGHFAYVLECDSPYEKTSD